MNGDECEFQSIQPVTRVYYLQESEPNGSLAFRSLAFSHVMAGNKEAQYMILRVLVRSIVANLVFYLSQSHIYIARKSYEPFRSSAGEVLCIIQLFLYNSK